VVDVERVLHGADRRAAAAGIVRSGGAIDAEGAGIAGSTQLQRAVIEIADENRGPQSQRLADLIVSALLPVTELSTRRGAQTFGPRSYPQTWPICPSRGLADALGQRVNGFGKPGDVGQLIAG
jgi:hypothetical protein